MLARLRHHEPPVAIVVLTSYTDPAPQLKGIQKQLVTYKRNDGVELSATIITPPDRGAVAPIGEAQFPIT